MRTFTGVHIDPLDPQTQDINIVDIAHALALQCRYNGHSVGHLSVARHSLWVQEEVEVRHPYDYTLMLTALLHDASEAYLGDMIRPLKHRPEMAFFGVIEERMEAVIAAAFGLPYPMPQAVHDADKLVLIEREDIGHSPTDTAWLSDKIAFLRRYAFLQSHR
jgi:5'-deoxynucleotidase YfbR-like HD superfamily hydrolase